MDIQNIEARADSRFMPGWIKIPITISACSLGAVFVLAMLSSQDAIFGLSTTWIAVVSLALVSLLLAVAVAVWFFPGQSFALSIYWLIRYCRELICVFALLGMVVLLTVRFPISSLRGGIPFLNFLLLFLMGLFIQSAQLDQAPLAWMKRIHTFRENLFHRLNSIPAPIPGLFAASLPILVICSVIYLGLDARLSDYGPYSFWNDEMGYWVWVRSFSQAGFDAGYNAPNELIAPASFNHYGEGSPLYVYIYGAIARITGWYPYLPILINFGLLALAILLFTHFTKLEPVQTFLVGLVTILVWPVLLYLPMTTHETLNQAIAFLLAVIFFRLLAYREQVNRFERFLFILLIYLAALIRLSWGLLMIPALFYSLNGSILRRLLGSVLLGGVLYLSALAITNFMVPPVNNSILLNARESLIQGPQILIDYIATQFRLMFKFRQLNPNIAVMFQIFIILGWSLLRLVRMIRTEQSAVAILQSQTVFNMYNVASLAAAGLLFYIQEGFYRTFTPSLLLVYLLLVTRKDYRFLTALLAINLVFFHSYMTFYARAGDAAIIRTDYTFRFPEQAQWQSDIENWIAFDENTQNPWCNTLLIPLHFYDYRLTVIPAGIGISYIYDLETMHTPIKSKYLLLDRETHEALSDRLNAVHLDSLSIGELYYNPDSGCKFNP